MIALELTEPLLRACYGDTRYTFHLRVKLHIAVIGGGSKAAALVQERVLRGATFLDLFSLSERTTVDIHRARKLRTALIPPCVHAV
jgi:hypothetical protein